MGSAASAARPTFDEEWASESTRVLDSLGGGLRPPVKRGLSTKFRLEWLKDALAEQGDKLEEALAKDPLAGRHEILRQEAIKMVKDNPASIHSFSVKEWMTRKHSDMRAQHARDELERRMRERMGLPPMEPPAPAPVNSEKEHSKPRAGEGPPSPPKRPSEAGNPGKQRVSEAGGGGGGGAGRPEWNSLHWTNTSIPDLPNKKSAANTSENKQTSEDGGEPAKPVRPEVPLAEWRYRVARAKRKALLIIRVVLAFRGRRHRARGLQRLDSLSYFIAQHLADQLPRFVDEQASYRAGKASVANLQALAEELWREQNYGTGGEALESGEDAGLALSSGDIGGAVPSALSSMDLSGAGAGLGGRGMQPWSPGAPVRQAASMPAAVMAAAAGPGPGPSGGSGSGRATPPPPLRLPGSWTAGPSTAGASSGAGAGGGSGGAGSGGNNNGLSPMLRSRPMNLTPTLHHITQAGGGAASAASSAAPSPVAAAAAAAPAAGGAPGSPGGSTSTSGLNSARMSFSGAAAGPPGGPAGPPGAAVAASLPQLPRPGAPGGGRMSTPSGGLPPAGMPTMSAGQVLLGGGGGGSGLEPEASASSITSGRTSRFSVPGALVSASADFSMVSAAGGGARAVSALEDGMSLQEAAAAGRGGGKGPKWSMPRFLGGGKGKNAAGPGALDGDGGGGAAAAAAGPPNGKRGPKGSLLAAGGDELSMVARAQSWAGPMPNPALGPPAVPHSRSLGPGEGSAAASTARAGAAAATAMAPAPPTAPAPPAGTGRNPRNRRSSAIVLGSNGSALPPSFIAAMGKVSTDGSAALSTPGEAPGSPGWNSRGPPGAGGPRGARAGSTSGAFGQTARSTGGAPAAGGGGAAPNMPRRAFGTRRGSTTGEGPPTPGGGRGASVSGGAAAAAAAAAATAAATAAAVARRAGTEGGSEAVFLRFQEEQAALEKPLRMMNMYANRANARWVEELATAVSGGGAPPSSSPGGGLEGGGPRSLASPTGAPNAGPAGAGSAGGGGGFEPPQVYEAAKFASVMGAAQSAAFKSEVAAALRAGRMAVQVLAGDDNVILASGATQALWSADPWDLIATAFPAKAGTPDRIRAVHMGPRLLMALVMAVEAVAGPEAVARLPVVLHCNEDQRADVIADLRFRKFCGLRPENLFLLVQTRRCGYVWDEAAQRFARDEASTPASAGSGYAIMQLVWPQEAVQLAAEDPAQVLAEAGPSGSGPAVEAAKASLASARRAGRDAATAGVLPLTVSVLDALAARGVQWLLTRRLRDINLYHPERTLDGEVLAYGLFLHDSCGANMSVQVEYVDGVQAVRQAQSGVVLAAPRPPRRPEREVVPNVITVTSSLDAPGSPSHPRRRAHGRDQASQPEAPGSPARRGGGPSGSSGSFVMDIKVSDTMTPRVTALLNEARLRGKGRLVVSTRRYMWKIDVLKALVQRPSVFRPSLEVAADLAYLTFDMADLTAATQFGARCVALASRHPTRSLIGAGDLEDLMGVISAQDASGNFRRLAGNTTVPRAQTAPAGSEATRRPALSPQLHSLSVGPGGGGGAAAAGGFSYANSGSAAAAAAAAVANGIGAGTPGMLGGGLGTPHSSVAAPGGGGGGGPLPGQRIVVLVADNDSTGTAVKLLMAMVKPGRDVVVLVHVVSSILQEGAGRALLRKHELLLGQTMVEVVSELLTKDPSTPLLEQLEAYCENVDAQLVVMGSQVLANASAGAAAGSGFPGGGGGGGGFPGSSGASFSGFGGGSGSSFSLAGAGGGGGGGSIIGSMALSLLKTAMRPMLIVKANAKLAAISWDSDKLRLLMEVHHTSRHLLRYAATKLLNSQRGDKLYLGRGGAKDPSAQDNVTSRRLLENFADIAAQHGLGAVKRPLEEGFETGALRLAELEKVHVLAMQAPSGRGLPASIMHVLKAARSAVLIYKTNESF
ncbi:hypothetical protein HXX76_014445 [Chlamydomonas incerta]|uniref:Uncharacterized protein n=1 Tax=Chlamydomonas incerta TaxID=51695 RepID=A0A835SQ90_CHLIN|nr:hypothetical protein HXX76_014445 [Chlamydomonas incerta]|eukprot:KAG2424565.1 hypothetical protein HXX76_014445 [Chlamydomonas incerta]